MQIAVKAYAPKASSGDEAIIAAGSKRKAGRTAVVESAAAERLAHDAIDGKELNETVAEMQALSFANSVDKAFRADVIRIYLEAKP